MRYPPLHNHIAAFNNAISDFRASFQSSPALAKKIVFESPWFQITSCLSALDDTARLLQYYADFLESRAETEPNYEAGTGELYMNLYGILQAIFVQQDALRHLAEIFGVKINIEDFTGMAQVRELRNFSVGHPTKKGRPQRRHVYSEFPDDSNLFGRLPRGSLTRDSFALEVSGTKGGETRLHHLQPLIISQLKDAVSILDLVASGTK